MKASNPAAAIRAFRALAGKARAFAGKVAIRVRAAFVKTRAFARRVAVRMLASALASFTIVFVAASSLMLAWQLSPWIFHGGVADIDPLLILLVSLMLAFSAMYARHLLMKRFSGISP